MEPTSLTLILVMNWDSFELPLIATDVHRLPLTANATDGHCHWLSTTSNWIPMTLYWLFTDFYWHSTDFYWLSTDFYKLSTDFYWLSTDALLISTDSILTFTDSLLTFRMPGNNKSYMFDRLEQCQTNWHFATLLVPRWQSLNSGKIATALSLQT